MGFFFEIKYLIVDFCLGFLYFLVVVMVVFEIKLFGIESQCLIVLVINDVIKV